MSFYEERIEARRAAEEEFAKSWDIFSNKATPMSNETIDILLTGQLTRVRTVLPFNEDTQAIRDRLLIALDPQNPNYSEVRVAWLQETHANLDSLRADKTLSGQDRALYSKRASAVGRALSFLGASSYLPLTR